MDNILNQEEIEKIKEKWYERAQGKHEDGVENLIKAAEKFLLSKLSVSDEKLVEIIAKVIYDTARQGSLNLHYFAEQHGIELVPKYEPTNPLPEWGDKEDLFKSIWTNLVKREISPYLTLKIQEARKEERERIGTYIYDSLPIGEVTAFDLVKWIKPICEKLQDGQVPE